MKKISILLAILMVVSVLSVCASAAPAIAEGNEAVVWLDPYVASTGVSTTEFVSGTNYGIAVRLDTSRAFCFYQFTINWDPAKLQFVNKLTSIGKYAGTGYQNTSAAIGFAAFNDVNPGADKGQITYNYVSPTNIVYTNEETFEDAPVTQALTLILIFKVATTDACDATVSFTYTEAKDASLHLLPSSGESLSLKINGGAPAAAAPIVSLGAQANSSLVGLRFGATYNKVAANGNVTDLGMLLLPQAKLGDAELNLTTSGPVAKLSAKGIDAASYVANQAFADYTTFTFHCAVIGLTGHETDNIVARPFITYEGDAGTIYADALVKNYTAVLAAAGN